MSKNPRAVIGNNAPPLSERLEVDYDHLAEQMGDVRALPPLPPIMDDDDLMDYSERAKRLKVLIAAIEKARKAEKDQILKDGRTIDGFFQKISKPVSDAFDALVAAINAEQRRKRDEQLRIEREADEQRRRDEEAAKVFALPDEPAPEPERAPPPTPVREIARVVSSQTGRVTASASVKWLHEVEDFDKIPREYLVLNDARIKAEISAGKRDVPGIRYYEDLRTAIR